jgi:hypothetical protein
VYPFPGCTCPYRSDGTGRDGWDTWCPLHGIDARIAAEIWKPEMRDMWNKARCDKAAGR